MARQDLSDGQMFAIRAAWDNDISVDGFPEGWDYESFERKVSNYMYAHPESEFHEALAAIVWQCPRPDDLTPDQERQKLIADKKAEFKAKLDAIKIKAAIDFAKKNPAFVIGPR